MGIHYCRECKDQAWQLLNTKLQQMKAAIQIRADKAINPDYKNGLEQALKEIEKYESF